MGNTGGRPGGPPGARKPGAEAPKKKKFEPKALTKRIKKKRKAATAGAGSRLPKIFPTARCKLRELKLARVKDFLLMEREFITNQEVLRPKAERETAGAWQEVGGWGGGGGS